MFRITLETTGFGGTGSAGTGPGGTRSDGTGPGGTRSGGTRSGGTRKSSWSWRSLFVGCGRWIVGVLTLGTGVVVGIMAGRHRLWEFYYNGTDERAFFILFVVAGLFPFSAIAYRIFQRDTQLAELQKEFELLGIVKHESSTSDSSGQEYVLLRYTQSYGLWNFAIQSMFAVYLTAIGLSLFFWPPQIDGNHLLDANTLQAMRYGFLGAYIYSLQLIYRRYTTLDLQPTVYMNCTLTMISGLAFNYVAFQAISKLSATPNANQVATGAEAGLVAIVAFSLGYFPYLALGWFNRLAHTAIGVRQRRSDALQLELIDGISQLHETRLRDEGIENIQNLAAAPIDQLIVNTRFSAQQVIEWIDQAILYLERSV